MKFLLLEHKTNQGKANTEIVVMKMNTRCCLHQRELTLLPPCGYKKSKFSHFYFKWIKLVSINFVQTIFLFKFLNIACKRWWCTEPKIGILFWKKLVNEPKTLLAMRWIFYQSLNLESVVFQQLMFE